MKIYVASSWRNTRQPTVVAALRGAGHEVYDFRNPKPGQKGFSWREVDENWKNWDTAGLVAGLEHPIAKKGFNLDMKALREADVCVLVAPAGPSTHLEAGFAVGAGKRVIVLLDDDKPQEPDLMYRMCSLITHSIPRVLSALADAA
jgi:hypothetical protein